MLDETFYLDGVDARTVGIHLQKPIEFDGIKPIIYRQHIPGRNGDLIFETGAYENRKGKANCFALEKDVWKTIDKASAFLQASNGYRRLECSNDPEHFWLARVENGVHIEQRMGTLNPFSIKFDCKPQRFEKSGEQPIVFQGVDGKLNTTLKNNFSGNALPLIKVYSSNTDSAIGSITINGNVIRFASSYVSVRVLEIDCDLQNVMYKDGDIYKNANRAISVSEFPFFHAGENKVSFSGTIDKLEIIPRWWSK